MTNDEKALVLVFLLVVLINVLVSFGIAALAVWIGSWFFPIDITFINIIKVWIVIFVIRLILRPILIKAE